MNARQPLQSYFGAVEADLMRLGIQQDAEDRLNARLEQERAELRAEFLETVKTGVGEVEFTSNLTALKRGSEPVVSAVDGLMAGLWSECSCGSEAEKRLQRIQLALIGSNHPAAAEMRELLADEWMRQHGDDIARGAK